jgi:hypothetical protein
MNAKKEIVFISAILLLGVLLRMPFLDSIPRGFHWDESGYAYNGYSILKTGKDEWGNFLPLYLKSFGDYKSAILSYIFALAFLVSNASVFTARLTVVILSLFSLIVFYYLLKKLTKNVNFALVGSLIMAITPWHIHYSRAAVEQILAFLLLVLGAWCFLNKKAGLKIIGSIALVLSMYTYHSSRIFIPVFFIGSIFYSFLNKKDNLFVNFRQNFLANLIVIFGSAFFIYQSLFGIMGERARNVSIVKEVVMNEVNERLYRSNVVFGKSLRIFNNKIIILSNEVLKRYLSHFQFDFLFFGNNLSSRSAFLEHGNLLLITLPFLILGLIIAVRRLNSNDIFFGGWLIIAPLASAITKDVPHSGRTIIILPALIYLITTGIWWSSGLIKKSLYANIFKVVILLAFLVNTAVYVKDYILFFPEQSEKDWQGNLVDVSHYVYGKHDLYSKILFEENYSANYIFVVWHNLIDPKIIQSSALYPKAFENLEFKHIERQDYACAMLTPNNLVVADREMGAFGLDKIFYSNNRFSNQKDIYFVVYDSNLVKDSDRIVLQGWCGIK